MIKKRDLVAMTFSTIDEDRLWAADDSLKRWEGGEVDCDNNAQNGRHLLARSQPCFTLENLCHDLIIRGSRKGAPCHLYVRVYLVDYYYIVEARSCACRLA